MRHDKHIADQIQQRAAQIDRWNDPGLAGQAYRRLDYGRQIHGDHSESRAGDDARERHEFCRRPDPYDLPGVDGKKGGEGEGEKQRVLLGVGQMFFEGVELMGFPEFGQGRREDEEER